MIAPRRIRRLGHVQADVLDSLRRCPETASGLAEETGRPYRRIQFALSALLRAGLVRRWGWRSLGCRFGSVPWRWAITRPGLRELALREQIGVVPGAPYTGSGRLEAPCSR